MPWILLCSLHCLLPRFPPPPSPACRRLTLIKTAPANPMWNRKSGLCRTGRCAGQRLRPSELIDQLRKAAATPPPDSTPTLTPPAVKEETTVLENVTQISREYGEQLSSRFSQLWRNITGSPHKPFNPQTFTSAAWHFYRWPGWCLPSGGWYASRRCRCIAKWANGDGIKTAIAVTGSSCPDHRRGVYHRPAAGANPVCRSAAKRSPEWE